MIETLRDLAYRAVSARRRNARLEGCILVNGSPRSGTTWLGEWIGAATDFVETDEPLNDRRLSDWAKQYGFTNRPYRHPERDDPQFLGALADLFSGRYVRPFTFHRDQLPKLAVGRPVVTKIITGNLLMPWLAPRMPALKIVQIVRDPLATIASQMMYPTGAWTGLGTISKEYSPFLQDHPEYASECERFGTLEEVLAAHWAIEHRYLLEQRERWRTAHFVRYENMVKNREESFRGIARFLDIPWTPSLFASTHKESSSVQKTSALKTGGDPTKRFKEQLNADQIARIERVLDRFGRPFCEQRAVA